MKNTLFKGLCIASLTIALGALSTFTRSAMYFEPQVVLETAAKILGFFALFILTLKRLSAPIEEEEDRKALNGEIFTISGMLMLASALVGWAGIASTTINTFWGTGAIHMNINGSSIGPWESIGYLALIHGTWTAVGLIALKYGTSRLESMNWGSLYKSGLTVLVYSCFLPLETIAFFSNGDYLGRIAGILIGWALMKYALKKNEMERIPPHITNIAEIFITVGIYETVLWIMSYLTHKMRYSNDIGIFSNSLIDFLIPLLGLLLVGTGVYLIRIAEKELGTPARCPICHNYMGLRNGFNAVDALIIQELVRQKRIQCSRCHAVLQRDGLVDKAYTTFSIFITIVIFTFVMAPSLSMIHAGNGGYLVYLLAVPAVLILGHAFKHFYNATAAMIVVDEAITVWEPDEEKSISDQAEDFKQLDDRKQNEMICEPDKPVVKATKKKILIIVGMIALVVGALVFINSKTLDGNSIVTAKLSVEGYGTSRDEVIPLSGQDQQEIVRLINSMKKRADSFSYGSGDDCVFNFDVQMKTGKQKRFIIVITENQRVLLVEEKMPTDQLQANQRSTAWYLGYTGEQKALEMPALREYYSTSNMIEPIIYAGGIEIDGRDASENWEYQNHKAEWASSGPLSDEGMPSNTVEGRRINVLYPGYPKQVTYCIKDEQGSVVEQGALLKPFLDLPEYDKNYGVSLTAVWDYEGVKPKGQSSIESVPNAYRGTVVTEFVVMSHREPVQRIPDADWQENKINLLPLEETFKSVGIQYFLDKNQGTLSMDSAAVKDSRITIKEVAIAKLGNGTYYSVEVNGQKVKRKFFDVNGVLYSDANGLAQDLDMKLLKSENNAYALTQNKALYPLTDAAKRKDGYINNQGKWIIPPILERAQDFIDGYGVFSINGDPASIESIQGNISGAEFSQFSADMQNALVDFYTSDVDGLMDSNGKVLIPPVYNSLSYRGGNVAIARGKSDQEGFKVFQLEQGIQTDMPNQGIPVFSLRDFSEGLFIAEFSNDEYNPKRFGYVDINGNIVLEPEYASATPFVDGKAIVGSGNVFGMKYGAINRRGVALTPFVYDEMQPYSEGLTCIKITRNRMDQYAFIDSNGDFVSGPEFRYASNFRNGLAVVNHGNEGNLAYIKKDFSYLKDDKGNVIVNGRVPKPMVTSRFVPVSEYGPQEYRYGPGDELFCFSEGYAVVFKDGLYGYIDQWGNTVIDYAFKDANPFKNGMALVGTEGDQYSGTQSAYVSTLGKIIEIEAE